MAKGEQTNFRNPPVIEAVIGIQFERLAHFSCAHAGWFWKEQLADVWPRVSFRDVPRLPDQFEKFGEEQSWSSVPGITLAVGQGGMLGRVQIICDGEERMIQLQDSRFIYNWQKQGASYPSHETVVSDFEALWERFAEFAAAASLGNPEPNQWEITYIDHIPKGELWQSVDDWKRVLPGIYAPGVPVHEMAAQWAVGLPDHRGRMHIAVQRAKIRPDAEEAILIHYTARGPIKSEEGWGAVDGFRMGHKVILEQFLSMTSEAAKAYWGRL